MFLNLFYLLLFLSCVVKIDAVSTVKNRKVIQKCCDYGQILKINKCVNITDLPNPGQLKYNFSATNIYTWNESKQAVTVSTKHFDQEFEVIENNGLKKCNWPPPKGFYKSIFLLEDGSLQIERTDVDNKWVRDDADSFCMEYKVTKENGTRKLILAYQLSCNEHKTSDEMVKTRFVVSGLLISCLFMLLVLVVYYLLPNLRNLPGLILMVYLITMIVCFASKAALIIFQSTIGVTRKTCEIVSPLIYYVMLASFLWSNIMAVQAWKNIAGTRLQSLLTRYEERVKFRKYNIIVWSVTLGIVGIALLIEYFWRRDYINPTFRECMNTKSSYVWVAAPVAVLTSINIVFFILTVRYTFTTNRVMTKKEGSGNTSSNRRRIRTGGYIKFSVLMGISWLLEVIPNNIPLWVFIVVNLYNVSIGLALFWVFVLNKRVISGLCKRFHISDPYIDRTLSQTTKSSSVKLQKSATSEKSNESTVV